MKPPMIKTLFSLLSLFFIAILSSSAQDLSGIFEGSEKDYFSSKNLIKINFIPLFQGELPITYERCFGDYFSIETGVGIQLPYIIPDYTMFMEEYTDFRKPDLSFHYWFAPKVFLTGGAPEGFFIGLQLRRKNYHLWAGDVNFTDLTVTSGVMFFNSDHFLTEVNIGYGMRMTDDMVNEILDLNATMALAVKIAYVF